MTNPDIRALQNYKKIAPPGSSSAEDVGQLVWIPPGYEIASEPQAPPKQSHLWDYIWLVWRGRWLVIFVFLLCIGVAGVRMLRATPIYQATAKLQISSQTPKIINLGEERYAQSAMDYEYVGTQMLVLRSRTLARQVVEKLNLFAPNTNPPKKKPHFLATGIASVKSYLASFAAKDKASSPAPGAKAAATADTTAANRRMAQRINALLGSLSVSQIHDTEVISVAYLGPDPAQCAQVANAVCDAYIEWNYQTKTNSYEYARKWIDQKLYEVKANLEKSEENLYEVGGGQDVLALTEGADNFSSKLDEMNLQLVASEQKLHDQEFLLDSIRKGAFSQDLLSSASVGSGRTEALRADLEKAEVEYDKAIQQLGPETAEVKILQAAKSRLQSQIAAELKRSSGITLAKAQLDYDQAKSQRDFLKKSYNEQKQYLLALQQRLIKFNILKREVEVNRDLYNSLLQRSREVGVTSGLKAGNISIVERAEIPLLPSLPNKRRAVALGGLVGLFLGVGLVFFREYMDTSIRGSLDVQNYGKLATLGLLPHIEVQRFKKGEKRHAELICAEEPRSTFAENIRHFRTALQYSLAGRSPKTVLVTSCITAEGKTTVASNLAIALAQSGRKTILVDADLKKPSIHKFFDVDRENGLSDILTGKVNGNFNLASLKSSIDNLYILPSGNRPPNPVDLLDSVVMRNLLAKLGEHFDHIILDSPPSLDLPDTSVLFNHVDGVVIVVKPGKTPRASLVRMREKVIDFGGRVLGVVLNDRKARSPKRYGYGYRYAYKHRGHGRYGYGYGDDIPVLEAKKVEEA